MPKADTGRTKETMVGLLSPGEIESLLLRHRMGRIAYSLDGRPVIVPMNYRYDGAAVYAVSGPGQKIDAMREQPRVSFEIDEVDAAGAWRSVVADGLFQELTDHEERRAALHRLGTAWAGADCREAIPPPSLIVFCLNLLEKTGRFGSER